MELLLLSTCFDVFILWVDTSGYVVHYFCVCGGTIYE